MNLGQHAKASLLLHILALPLIAYSLSLSFFIYFPNNYEFLITISSIKFIYNLDQSLPVDLYSTFSALSKTCSSNTHSMFSEVCPKLFNFSSGGRFFLAFSLLVSGCLTNSIVNIWQLITTKKDPNFEFTFFMSPLLYFIGILLYLLISSIGVTDCKPSSGILLSILIEVYLILLTFHYYFLIRSKVPEQLLSENELKVEANDPVYPKIKKISQDTVQSDEVLIRGNTTTRRLSNQSIQVEGNIVDSQISEQLKVDIKKLSDQKKHLEKSTSHLKNLIESSSPDISLYKSKLEIKNNEISKLNDFISEIKEKLMKKDEILDELNKDLKMYKALSDSLSTNNSSLNKDLNEKDKIIEELKNSLNFKTFEDLSESIKKEPSSQNLLSISKSDFSVKTSEKDSLLERINSLSQALEFQKEINEQLNSRNKKLEETTKKIEIDFSRNPQIQKLESANLGLKEKILKLKEKKKNSSKIIEAQLGQIKDLKQNKSDLALEASILRDKSSNFENMYLDLSSLMTRSKNEWDVEKEDLKYAKSLLQRELDSLKSRMKLQEDSLNSEIICLSSEIDRLRDQLNKSQIEMTEAKAEIENIKDTYSNISSDRFFETEQKTPSKSMPEKSSKTQESIENSLQTLINEKEELRISLIEKDQALQELSEVNQMLNEQLYSVKDAVKKSGISSQQSLYSQYSETSSQTSVLSVQEMMLIESLVGIDYRANPLLEKVSKLKKEPPMIYSNLWKILEKLMNEKEKVDKLDLALKRKPRAMFEFVGDFFLSHFGLQTLANRQLKAMTNSLEDLHKLGHPYGVFFSRLLALYHPRPIPVDFSVFLMIVQGLFNRLSYTTRLSWAQHYEILQYGGQASLVDAMEVIMKICKNRTVGERIICSLHKDTDKQLEIALIKACGTLAKMKTDSKSVFELLDSNESKSLDYHEFVDGIRYTLGIWVTQNEAEDICGFIDKNSNGLVSFEEWVERVDLQEYREKVKQPEYSVTKVQVLNAFIDEYELEMIEDYEKVRGIVKGRSLDKEMFWSTIKEIDRNLKDREIEKLFEKLRKEENSEVVTTEGTCLMIMKNKIGGYGVGSFKVDEIEVD